MITLGITGGIGSGKSIVTDIFRLYDIPVYIADVESKKLTTSSPIIREKLTHLFGTELYEGGTLNKALLASHIFSNKDNLEKVNAIIHPEVERDYRKWVKKHEGEKILAKEAAILFESGFNKFVDKTIMVYAPLEMRIERVIKRDNSDRQKVIDRIKSQMPDEEKAKLSDYIIVNDGTKSLIEQVVNIIEQLKDEQ